MAITAFTGEYAFLSNFYPSIIIYDGIAYPTVEHYFQALKTENGNGRLAISQTITPDRAKRLGRALTLRSDWETIKVYIMYKGLIQKFMSENTELGLAQQLLDTGHEELVEGNNWHDNTWGVCHCNRITCIQSRPGRNYLGRLLMDIRGSLRQQSSL